ncbi:MAG: tetratricopeptide repeat protein [Gammaproteobacteria bacterium]
MKHTYQLNTFLFFVLSAFLTPVLADTELRKAQSLISEGKLQQAMSVTDEYLAKDSKSIEARFIKGLILTKSGHLEKAEELFLELTKEHPDLPEPFNNLAVIYASQGKYEKARITLQEAINTHPSYATAHENIGDIYAKMASQAYNQALQLDAGNQAAKEKLSLISELFSVPKPIIQKQVAVKPKEQVTKTPKEEIKPIEPSKEKLVATAPVTKPAPEKIKDDKTKLEKVSIIKSVYEWANAWSKQDVDAYLAYYADEFIPPNDITRGAWEALREKRLRKPKFINVDVIKPVIVMYGNDHAQIDFSQGYQSDTFQDEVDKTLLMKNSNGEWLIVEEKTR